MGDRNGLSVTQTILGDLHLRLGKLDLAGSEFSDALAAARSVGSLRMEAFAAVSLGQWHRANGRLNEAVTAFDEGLRLSEEIVERELLADALVWRAEVALLCEDLTTARRLLARAQAEGQRIGASATLASVDRALGRLHLVDGAGARAVSHLEAAVERGDEAWGPDQRAETQFWLGTAYLNLGRAQQATACLERAIAIAEELDTPALLAGAAAEDGRLLRHGREIGLKPALLAEVERLATIRRPWTGVGATPVAMLVQNDLPRLEVQLFGSFVLHRDGQLVSRASRKVDRARELAAVLILNPAGLRDDTIAEMMFPEMQREKALHNLQMAAYSLRNDLGSKAAVRYGARSYQLNPQLELVADVRDFDEALSKSHAAVGDLLVQWLSRALELYRGPLLAEAAWDWLEPVRLDYRSRYVSAALQLADLLAASDPARSDACAEQALSEAPETDLAYERLIENARRRGDNHALRRVVKRYVQAAAQFGFAVNRHLLVPERRAS
jgi:tetratricopeptide (TPR) repeat protein